MQNIKRATILLLGIFICSVIHSQDYILGYTPEWKIDSAEIADKSNISKSNQWKILKYDPAEITSCDFGWKGNYTDRFESTISALGIFSDADNAPFWLTNNQHGIGSVDKNKEYLRVNSFFLKKFKTSQYPVIFSSGFDFLISHNFSSDFYIQQLFAEVKYWNTSLSVGMKERNSLFKNKDLSSGGLTLSSNARPIPQVEFSIPNFISILPNNKLQIMGGISYGWTTDTKFKKKNAADRNYAEDVLYHRKYGFMKYQPNQVWDFIVGLEMDTQWGGQFYRKGEYWYKSSAKIKDFFKVLVPMSGGSNSNITDKVNVTGNVYGSTHFIANYKRSDYNIKAYHEHFFEDHSGLFFKNIPDGLYGFEINLKKIGWISDIVFEYLHSKDQSGPFLWDKDETIPIQVSAGDNYYNHVDYISLSNYGFVVGNPLFVSPIYNHGQSLTVYNTRLSAFHGGIGGYLAPHLRYRTLFTYSRSWGTPLIPSVNIRDQFSSMLEMTYNNPTKMKDWLFSGAIAYDKSEMVGDNIGLQIKVSKSFNIPVK